MLDLKLTEEQLADKSEAFKKFHASLQDSDPRDGPQIDVGALCSLESDEFVEAENILIKLIESGWGAPITEVLADIKSRRGAVVLKQLIKAAGGITAAEMALALWRIEAWPGAQKVVIAVLEGRRNYFDESKGLNELEWRGRMEAARALAYIPGEASVRALKRALDDPEFLVRYWAQISLNILTAENSLIEPDLTRRIRQRRKRRKYDWSGYVLWFAGGMLLGGIPILLPMLVFTTHFSFIKLIGVMMICGLIGGLLWGRKHRLHWENENRADELLEEVVRNKRD